MITTQEQYELEIVALAKYNETVKDLTTRSSELQRTLAAATAERERLVARVQEWLDFRIKCCCADTKRSIDCECRE